MKFYFLISHLVQSDAAHVSVYICSSLHLNITVCKVHTPVGLG